MATTDTRNRVALENDGSRVDGIAKVTGAAKYTRDYNLPNMAYARHIRAPYANGKLTKKECIMLLILYFAYLYVRVIYFPVDVM